MELNNCEMAILSALVRKRKDKGYNLHELSEITRIEKRGKQKSESYSYPAVRKYMPQLVKKRLAKRVGDPEPYHGYEMLRYDVTFLGMMVSFLHHDVIKSVYNIIKTFQDELPLIFGKWKYFRERGAENIAKKHLVCVMKLCASEYQRILTEIEQHDETKGLRWVDSLRETQEKWKEEKTWAIRITDEFLYYGLEKEHLSRFFHYEEADEVLNFDERSELISAIENDEELRLYKLMIQRRETEERIRKAELYRLEHIMPGQIEEKIIERLHFKAWENDPYYEVVDALYDEDYFDVAFKLINLYVDYPFDYDEDENEAVRAIPQFMLELIKIANSRIGHAMRNARSKHEELPYAIRKDLEKAKLNALSAQYFYKPEIVKVWDRNFLRLRRREDRIEWLNNKPAEAKAEALKWARMISEKPETERLLGNKR